jgi:preprotein translocase subunit SecE
MATSNTKNDEAQKAKPAEAKKKDSKKDSKNKKPGLVQRATTYFKGVKSEIKRVTWPTKGELVKYTGAVVGMLIFFGILIAIVDAVIVPVLYAYQGLR